MLEVPTRARRTTTSTSLVVLAHLGPVVEVDLGEDVAAVGMFVARAPHDLGHQRDPALLEQLVVDRLVEVAEQVDVAPAELDADALLECRRHGRQSKRAPARPALVAVASVWSTARGRQREPGSSSAAISCGGLASRAVRRAVEERFGEAEVGLLGEQELDHLAPAVERGPDQRVVDQPVRIEPGTAGTARMVPQARSGRSVPSASK